MVNSNELSAILLVPFIASVLAWFIPKVSQRLFAILSSSICLAVSAYVVFQGGVNGAGLQQALPWLDDLGIRIQLQADAISGWFLLLAGFAGVVISGIQGPWYRKQSRLYTSLLFFLLFSLNLAFLSTNLITFYLAYEAVFIPMILIVGVWGDHAKATSVFRFFLMSFLGSILMLVSIFYLSFLHFKKTGNFSSNLTDIMMISQSGEHSMTWVFMGFVLAFAIKVPLVPFHGWLKEVYVNAPTPGTVWMSAVLSKLGVYGFIQFILPLFPNELRQFQGTLLALSALSVIYPAFLAIQSKKAKALLAYSSISHLGFVMLGVFSLSQAGKNSALILSMSHGLTSIVLFYLFSQIESRIEDPILDRQWGMAKKYPILFVFLFIGVLSSVSLPGTFNFVGEFLVLMNAYPVSALCTILSGFGVILGAIYMLKFYQQLAFGNSGTEETATAGDLSGFDLIVSGLILVLVIVLGIYPSLFFGGMTNG